MVRVIYNMCVKLLSLSLSIWMDGRKETFWPPKTLYRGGKQFADLVVQQIKPDIQTWKTCYDY